MTADYTPTPAHAPAYYQGLVAAGTRVLRQSRVHGAVEELRPSGAWEDIGHPGQWDEEALEDAAERAVWYHDDSAAYGLDDPCGDPVCPACRSSFGEAASE
jgi:hypothetical protein